MLDLAHPRPFAGRSKKYWVVALCAASFAGGNYLFGDDSDESESLLSQYQQATQQLVTEVQPQSARRPASSTSANPHTSRPQPAKAEAASIAIPGQSATSSVLVPQQKSSRRVKPSQPPPPETTVAKNELPPVKPEPPVRNESVTKTDVATKVEPLTTEETPAAQQPSEDKTELAQQVPAISAIPATAAAIPTTTAASEPSPAITPTENKPLPMVTYIPPQSEVTQRQLAPRMEIILPATTGTPSPRAQDPATQSASIAINRSVPMQNELRPTTPSPQASQPLPQIINVSRQSVAPPQPPRFAESLAELNDGNLPPIVSPDQVPRPGTRKKPIQPAAQSTAVLRIDLSKK
jgi:hypothetical protein